MVSGLDCAGPARNTGQKREGNLKGRAVLDLHRLQLLVELRRRGTITAVARAMSFSTSAVSQQLATLEREAGAKLLEPAGRRVRLTPQAELLADHAEELLTAMERAESAVAHAIGDPSGTLRVAAFQS